MHILLANDKEYEIASNAIITPGASIYQRNKMRLEFSEETMTEKEFNKLKNDTSVFAKVSFLFVTTGVPTHEGYTEYLRGGDEYKTVINELTGEATKEHIWYIELERLTFVEKHLAALGIKIQEGLK